MKLPNSVYNILKWTAIVALPALATFVTVVFRIWQLPYGDSISQTITALGVLLGALLCVSNATYKKEKEVADEE